MRARNGAAAAASDRENAEFECAQWHPLYAIMQEFEPNCMSAARNPAKKRVKSAAHPQKRIMKCRRVQTAKILQMIFASLQNEAAKTNFLYNLHKYQYFVL